MTRKRHQYGAKNATTNFTTVLRMRVKACGGSSIIYRIMEKELEVEKVNGW